MAPSLQIGANDVEQLLDGFGVQGMWMARAVDEVLAHMILDHFGHQSGHGAAGPGNEMHHLLTGSLAIERPLDRLDLAPNDA
jgi:hypothetical protein